MVRIRVCSAPGCRCRPPGALAAGVCTSLHPAVSAAAIAASETGRGLAARWKNHTMPTPTAPIATNVVTRRIRAERWARLRAASFAWRASSLRSCRWETVPPLDGAVVAVDVPLGGGRRGFRFFLAAIG